MKLFIEIGNDYFKQIEKIPLKERRKEKILLVKL